MPSTNALELLCHPACKVSMYSPGGRPGKGQGKEGVSKDYGTVVTPLLTGKELTDGAKGVFGPPLIR